MAWFFLFRNLAAQLAEIACPLSDTLQAITLRSLENDAGEYVHVHFGRKMNWNCRGTVISRTCARFFTKCGAQNCTYANNNIILYALTYYFLSLRSTPLLVASLIHQLISFYTKVKFTIVKINKYTMMNDNILRLCFPRVPLLISQSNAPLSFVLLGAMVMYSSLNCFYNAMHTFLFASKRCGWMRRLHSGRG